MHWRSDISFVPVLPVVAAFRTFRLSGHYFYKYYPIVLVTLQAKITIKGIVQPFELGGETRLIRSAVK